MKVYCPAGITRALGGVEKGEAKHIEAATVTAKRKGMGLMPIPIAHCKAMGAMSTAVTVLLMNIVITDEDWYEYIKLFAVFLKKAGYNGMLVLIEEE